MFVFYYATKSSPIIKIFFTHLAQWELRGKRFRFVSFSEFEV